MTAAWQIFDRIRQYTERRLDRTVLRQCSPPAAVEQITEPATRTLDQQWSSLEVAMIQNIEKAHGAIHKHAVAARHLDAAHYTLGRIAEELAIAMPPIELKPAVPVSAAFPVAGVGRQPPQSIAA